MWLFNQPYFLKQYGLLLCFMEITSQSAYFKKLEDEGEQGIYSVFSVCPYVLGKTVLLDSPNFKCRF